METVSVTASQKTQHIRTLKPKQGVTVILPTPLVVFAVALPTSGFFTYKNCHLSAHMLGGAEKECHIS